MIETEAPAFDGPGGAITAGEASALQQYRETREGLASLIERIAELPAAAATVFGGGRQGTLTVRDFYYELAPAIRSDTFRVAVVGEFSAGKSSLLNVLLGLCDASGKKTEGLLPTAIAPTTAVITTLYYRPDRHVEAVRKDGTRFEADLDDVSAYLTQPDLWRSRHPDAPDRERKEQIAAEVSEVRIGCDAPLLALGVEILDTPGLGAVYVEHGEITRRCVAGVDAALFLTGTDAPMGERDVTFLQYVSNFTDRLVFVQTKRDMGVQVDRGEPVWQRRERENRECIQNVLQGVDYPFYRVSANQAALALRQDNAEKLEASGVPELQRFLERFLVDLRGTPRLQSWGSRARRALELLRLHLRNGEAALDGRLREIEAAAPSAEDMDQWAMLRDVLDAEFTRIIEATGAGVSRLPVPAEAPGAPAADQPLEGIIGRLQQGARTDVQPVLAAIKPEDLGERSDKACRLERAALRSIQGGLRRELQPLQNSALRAAVKATEQALQEQMPAALRRYQLGGSSGAVLGGQNIALEIDLDSLISTTTTTREKTYRGFLDRCVGALNVLLGGSNLIEVTEHTLRPDYLWATVDKSVRDAVRTAVDGIVHEIELLREAAMQELERIGASARQAQEEQQRVRQQTRAKCEEELKQAREQLAQLESFAREMGVWMK